MVAPGDKYYSLCACVVASLATHIAKVQGSTRCIGPSASSALGVIVEANGKWSHLISVSGAYGDTSDTLRFQYQCNNETIATYVDVYPSGHVESSASECWRDETHAESLLW